MSRTGPPTHLSQTSSEREQVAMAREQSSDSVLALSAPGTIKNKAHINAEITSAREQ